MSSNLTRFRELTYPPPYLDGWYRVAASKEIKPGDVKHIQCMGTQIALFRSQACGRISAVDAFCPHRGANLAYGQVKGNWLQCPFHGWRVDGSGKVRACPDAGDRPIDHRHWEAIDYYGMVMVYQSAQQGTPPYRLPPQPGIDNRQLVCRGQYDGGEVEMHIVEFAENSVDFQHFSRIHSIMRIPWTSIGLPWTKIRHKPSWSLDNELEHICYFGDETTLEIGGRICEGTRSQASATFLGPGSIVQFDFHVPRIGKVTMFQTHTPVEPLKQRVTFRWFAAPHVPRLFVSYVIGSWVSQWRQDVKIWENKIYRQRPLSGTDGEPLEAVRKWYGQFYPDDPIEDL